MNLEEAEVISRSSAGGPRPWVGVVARFGLAFLLVGSLSLILHEGGHAVTAVAVGGHHVSLFVNPGVEIAPKPFDRYRGEPPKQDFPREYVGYFTWRHAEDLSEGRKGLVALMGSGTTFIAASLALALLWLKRPSGWPRHLLFAQAVIAVDFILYAFNDYLPGSHFFLIGGEEAEPLEGAVAMGVPRWLFLALALVASVAFAALLIRAVTRFPSGGRSDSGPAGAGNVG